MSDFIQQLWTAQEQAAQPPSEQQLRRRARRFHRQLAWRNAGEYTAGALVVGGFASYAWSAPTLTLAIGCLAVIAGTAVTLLNLWRRRGRKPDVTVDTRAFLRAELVRQRDALASIWRWYMLPIAVGMAVFLATVWLHAAGRVGTEAATLRILPVLALGAGTGLLIFWLNRAGARRLQRDIDELDLGEVG